MALILLGWAASSAVADNARAAASCRFRLTLAALNDASGTQVSLAILPLAPTCKTPTVLRSVRVKIYSRTGHLRGVRALRSVSSPGGRAAPTLKGFARGERLRVTVSFRRRTLTGRTIVRLRPDLVVTPVASSTSVAAATPSTIDATVAERNGDIGTTAA